MSIIQRVPWFRTYPGWGLHGVVCYPDGSKSKLLVTKKQAREFVTAMTDVTIQPDEAKALIEQINKSRLTESDEIAERLADQLSEAKIKADSGCRPS